MFFLESALSPKAYEKCARSPFTSSGIATEESGSRREV
jgi:hypothetical protein